MELSYENAGEGDVESIFRLNRVLIETYEDLGTVDLDRVLAWVRRKITQNIGTYTRVLAYGDHAGYFRFIPNGEVMELDDLYIFPEFQNRGIGTRIIEKCCAETERPVMLYTFNRNTGAVRLYRRLGFRVAETVSGSRRIMRREKESL